MQKSKYIVTDRFIPFTDPVTKEVIQIERTILRTKRICDGYYGDVKWKQREDGSEYLDYSGLFDPTPAKDFPEGMEVIQLACNADTQYVPVKFHYETIGEYSVVFIKAEDLEHVSGNSGTQVSAVTKIK